MKIKLSVHLILFSIYMLIGSGCEKDISVLHTKENSHLKFSLQFPNTHFETIGVSASKQNIDLVTLYIDGAGMDNPITKTMTISGSSANTSVEIPLGDKDFFVTASVKDGNLQPFDLFEGSESVFITANTSQVSIELEEITANDYIFAWHDGIFEDYVYTMQNSILAASFDISSIGPVYFKSISYNLQWSGNSGDYRIVIFDHNNDLRFRSIPLQAESDGIVGWNIVWDTPLDGKFPSIFTAGIEYETNNQWPEIGYDKTNPSGSSYFFDSSASEWFFMNDGDFAIDVTVQTKDGQEIILKPTKKMSSKSKKAAQLSELKGRQLFKNN